MTGSPRTKSGSDDASRALLERVSDGYLGLDRDWRIAYANASACRILGCRADDLVDRSLWETYPGLLGTPFEALYRRTMAGGEGGTLTAWYPDHGRWYEVTAFVAPPGLSICFRNVTDERARAQELERLYASSPVGLGLVDRELRFVRVNPALAAMNGLPVEAHLGRTLAEVVPAFADALEPVYRQVFATGEPVSDLPTTGPIPAEPQRTGHWLATFTPLRADDGAITHVSVVVQDVTAQKEVEARLVRNALTFEAIVRDNPYGVHVVDADWRVRHASRPVLEAFARVEGLVGSDFRAAIRAIWDERTADDLLARFEHVMATGEPHRSIGVVGTRTDTGVVEAYDWRVDRITLPDGRYGLVTHYYDLTERERTTAAFAALAESERRFRAVQDSSIDGFMLLESVRGPDGRIVDFRWSYANAAAERIVQAPAGGLVGRRMLEVHPGNRDQGLFDAYATVVETGEPFIREFSYRADGLDARLRIVAVRLGDGFAVTVADRGAQARVEEALEVANARLREATLAGDVGIHEYYPTEERLSWDGRMREWWGLREDEPVTFDVFVERVHPDDREAMLRAVERALDPVGGGRYDAEYRVVNPDGTFRRVHATGDVTFEGGRATRLIGTVKDVTEDRMLADALREADRRKDEFLAMLAHELRNPLAPITNAIRILDRLPELPAIGRRAVEMIDRQGRQMQRLVDDLLDVSRITRGTVQLRPETTSLGTLVLATADTLRPAAEAKRQRLRTVVPADAVLRAVDPVRIAQVLENLIGNAIKYTPEGGRIDVELAEVPEAVEVRVVDDGIGIDPADLERVFELFVQTEPGVGPHQGGLGIGLALVRRLVELHGGSVHAVSAGRGHGATFVVRLPHETARVSPGG